MKVGEMLMLRSACQLKNGQGKKNIVVRISTRVTGLGFLKSDYLIPARYSSTVLDGSEPVSPLPLGPSPSLSSLPLSTVRVILSFFFRRVSYVVVYVDVVVLNNVKRFLAFIWVWYGHQGQK